MLWHREFVPQNHVLSAQQSCDSTSNAKREESLCTAPSGSGPWQHPYDVGFKYMWQARILMLKRLPAWFLKVWKSLRLFGAQHQIVFYAEFRTPKFSICSTVFVIVLIPVLFSPPVCAF